MTTGGQIKSARSAASDKKKKKKKKGGIFGFKLAKQMQHFLSANWAKDALQAGIKR